MIASIKGCKKLNPVVCQTVLGHSLDVYPPVKSSGRLRSTSWTWKDRERSQVLRNPQRGPDIVLLLATLWIIDEKYPSWSICYKVSMIHWQSWSCSALSCYFMLFMLHSIEQKVVWDTEGTLLHSSLYCLSLNMWSLGSIAISCTIVQPPQDKRSIKDLSPTLTPLVGCRVLYSQ